MRAVRNWICAGVAGLVAAVALGSPASALSPDCERLRRAIADASRGGQGGQYQAAAERQRNEIDRTVAYADQIGCNNKKFLFFGSDPPAQCGQIRSQIGRMRANLDDLQSRAGGGSGGRGELIARFNAQCGNGAGKPGGIIDALFGQPKPGEMEEQPLTPDGETPPPAIDKPPPATGGGGEAIAGGKAVCVRSCDGAFFPLSYSASGARLDSLADMCRAQCPNAEVTLYTYPVGGEIEQAVSINGARYMDSPTALRYRKTFDPACSCRRKGQTWASALAPAESLLGKQADTDIIVTQQKSDEMARPKVEAKADAKPKPGKGAKPTPSPTPTPATADDGGKTDANGVDTNLRDATAAVSREGSGIGDAANSVKSGTVGEDNGRTLEETGPDGHKRKVRVIGQ